LPGFDDVADCRWQTYSAAEAGFFPDIILYLSYWFSAHRRAAITSLFMAAVPISVVLGSPLSSALLELHAIGGLKGWQWLFILESIRTVILGIIVLFYTTDKPQQATWLTYDERAWLVDTMKVERAKMAGTSHHSIWRGLADVRVLALALVYFGTSAGLYTLGISAPQIIKSFGLSNLQVVVLVNVGISAAKPPLRSMPTLFLSGPAAATGIAAINSIGNIGGFVGPAMIGWIKDLTGSFLGGLNFVSGLLLASAALTVMVARSLQRPAAAAVTAHS